MGRKGNRDRINKEIRMHQLFRFISPMEKFRRLIVTVNNNQFGYTLVRHLSSHSTWNNSNNENKNKKGKGQTVRSLQEKQRSRFQIPRRENPRLRVHAVSILHSDYSDDNPENLFKVGKEDEDEIDDALADMIQE